MQVPLSQTFSNTVIVFFKNANFVVKNYIICIFISLIRNDTELFAYFLSICILLWITIYVFCPFFNQGNHLLFY